MDADTILEIAKTFGLPTVILVILVWGLVRQWWVPGWTYRELKEDRDNLFSLLYNANTLASKGAEVSSRATDALVTNQQVIASEVTKALRTQKEIDDRVKQLAREEVQKIIEGKNR